MLVFGLQMAMRRQLAAHTSEQGMYRLPRLPRPTIRLIAIALCVGALAGCTIISVAGTVVGTAASVAGTVVSTTAEVAGAVVRGTANAVVGGAEKKADLVK